MTTGILRLFSVVCMATMICGCSGDPNNRALEAAVDAYIDHAENYTPPALPDEIDVRHNKTYKFSRSFADLAADFRRVREQHSEVDTTTLESLSKIERICERISEMCKTLIDENDSTQERFDLSVRPLIDELIDTLKSFPSGERI